MHCPNLQNPWTRRGFWSVKSIENVRRWSGRNQVFYFDVSVWKLRIYVNSETYVTQFLLVILHQINACVFLWHRSQQFVEDSHGISAQFETVLLLFAISLPNSIIIIGWLLPIVLITLSSLWFLVSGVWCSILTQRNERISGTITKNSQM